MTDRTEEFFGELQREGQLPLMEKVNGTLRVDLVDDKRTAHWFVTMSKGGVSVSRQGRSADCVLKGDKQLLERVLSGDVSGFTAILRGEIEIDGDPELMVLFLRAAPGLATRRRAEAVEPVGSRS
jgi:predicted lipid carrier protein YhbT